MRIPEKPLVPGGGLLKQEINDPRNHAIYKHVGRDQNYLQHRSVTEGLEHVSSFRDLEEAEYFVAETIKKKHHEINEWLTTNEKTKIIELRFSESTGLLFKQQEGSITEGAYAVKVVLKRAKKTPEGYTIRTAFPIEEVTK